MRTNKSIQLSTTEKLILVPGLVIALGLMSGCGKAKQSAKPSSSIGTTAATGATSGGRDLAEEEEEFLTCEALGNCGGNIPITTGANGQLVAEAQCDATDGWAPVNASGELTPSLTCAQSENYAKCSDDNATPKLTGNTFSCVTTGPATEEKNMVCLDPGAIYVAQAGKDNCTWQAGVFVLLTPRAPSCPSGFANAQERDGQDVCTKTTSQDRAVTVVNLITNVSSGSVSCPAGMTGVLIGKQLSCGLRKVVGKCLDSGSGAARGQFDGINFSCQKKETIDETKEMYCPDVGGVYYALSGRDECRHGAIRDFNQPRCYSGYGSPSYIVGKDVCHKSVDRWGAALVTLQ